MKLNLKNKFILPTLTLVLVITAITGSVSYTISKRALEDAIIERLSNTALENAKQLSSWLSDVQMDISTWGRFRVFKTAVKKSFLGKAARINAGKLLSDLKRKYAFFEHIAVFDTSGIPIVSDLGETVKDINISRRQYFLEALKDRIPISKVLISKSSNRPIFVIASPIKNEQGTVIAVIIGGIDLAYLSRQYIDSIRIGQSGYAFLFDNTGRILVHPDEGLAMNATLAGFYFGKKMLGREKGVASYSWQGSQMVTAFKKIAGTMFYGNWHLFRAKDSRNRVLREALFSKRLVPLVSGMKRKTL